MYGLLQSFGIATPKDEVFPPRHLLHGAFPPAGATGQKCSEWTDLSVIK